MRGQYPQRGDPLGTGAVGLVDHGVHLGQEGRPHRRHGSRRRAQGAHRPELPADHRHDDDRGEQGGGQLPLGLGELGVGLVEEPLGTRRCQVVRETGWTSPARGGPGRSCRAGRPDTDRAPSDHQPHDHDDDDDRGDQPPPPPPSASITHGNHSVLQASGAEWHWHGRARHRWRCRVRGPGTHGTGRSLRKRVHRPPMPRPDPVLARPAPAIATRPSSIATCRSRPFA